MGQDHGFWGARRIVSRREPPSENWCDSNRGESPVCDYQGPDFFRLSKPCDTCGLGVPHAELLKGLVVFTVGEVHRRREPDVARGHPLELRGVPDPDQCVRLRIRQRPYQYAVDDAEDRRGCANT